MKRSKSAENLITFSIPRGLKLLSGEKCMDKQQVIYIYSESQVGNLFVTNYRMYFQAIDIDHERSIVSENFDIPLGLISKIKTEKCQRECFLNIWCKNTRKFQFQVDNSAIEIFLDKLKKFTFPLNHDNRLFAFSYSEAFSENGWKIYDPLTEFHRMKIDKNPNIKWRITNANQNYELCDTYPSLLVIPNFKDKELSAIASFRSKKRLPVLSWIHPRNLASMTRCSQPLNGISGHRSPEDERCLNVIRLACPKNEKLIIVDARPLKNAMANKAKGGGYESQNSYQNTEIIFLNIENIHVMRESLRKLKEFCLTPPSEDKWLTYLENTMWLKHIKSILTGANIVADRINEGIPVLVHCSDGWDRTSQITSLAMLLLDPYYRTIKGFEVLIEKEWLSFGHKFQQRYGHGDMNYSNEERSPIFVQFIECVFQISRQYPASMEFNEHFLLTILDHLFSCRFGTFLCNSERERSQIKDKTVSLWSWMNLSLSTYQNNLYKKSEFVLKPIASMRYICLWKKYYHLDSSIPNHDANLSNTTLFEFKKVQHQIKKQLDRIQNSFKWKQNVTP